MVRALLAVLLPFSVGCSESTPPETLDVGGERYRLVDDAGGRLGDLVLQINQGDPVAYQWTLSPDGPPIRELDDVRHWFADSRRGDIALDSRAAKDVWYLQPNAADWAVYLLPAKLGGYRWGLETDASGDAHTGTLQHVATSAKAAR